jgi:hypothetical protein
MQMTAQINAIRAAIGTNGQMAVLFAPFIVVLTVAKGLLALRKGRYLL